MFLEIYISQYNSSWTGCSLGGEVVSAGFGGDVGIKEVLNNYNFKSKERVCANICHA